MEEIIFDFAKEMNYVYNGHSGEKGDSWRDCTVQYLFGKLLEEFSEVVIAYMHRDTMRVKKELIDLSLICMMLYWKMNDKLIEY